VLPNGKDTWWPTLYNWSDTSKKTIYEDLANEIGFRLINQHLDPYSATVEIYKVTTLNKTGVVLNLEGTSYTKILQELINVTPPQTSTSTHIRQTVSTLA
jgi:nucleoside diphosphate kinase